MLRVSRCLTHPTLALKKILMVKKVESTMKIMKFLNNLWYFIFYKAIPTIIGGGFAFVVAILLLPFMLIQKLFEAINNVDKD